MKSFFFIIFLFFIKFSSLNAFEISCKFEEVYSNGEIQNGIFFYKENKLRYQYSSLKLYTIIYDQKKIYMISNFNRDHVEILDDKENIIVSLVDLIKKYPNYDDQYYKKGTTIILEKNLNNNFIKRLAIRSSKLNLSIYFNDCNYNLISPDIFNVHKIKDIIIN